MNEGTTPAAELPKPGRDPGVPVDPIDDAPPLAGDCKARTEATNPPVLARLSARSIIIAIAAGILVGVGGFTFGYGKGHSYLSSDPTACANCHIMQGHLDSWRQSSHSAVAVCNDCHLPHDAIGKWVTKADNGFFHSLAFTIGDYPYPLQVKPRNASVTQDACLACHQELVHNLLPAQPGGDMLSCVHCHGDVGHSLHPHRHLPVR